MAAGRAYFCAEKNDLAAEWFEKVLQEEGPAVDEAAHWRSRLWLRAGEPEKALELIGADLPQAQTQNDAFTANLRMDQADATYELPDRKRQALEMYTGLARDLPDHLLAPQALYNAAFAALELKEYRNAQQLAQDFLSKYSEHRLVPDVKRIDAECLLQLGDSASAAETFARLASNTEDAAESGRLRLRQAVALYTEKEYDKTISQLSNQLAEFTQPDERAEVLHLIGMSQFRLEKFAEAKAALEQALEASPQWRQADETLLYLSRAERRLARLPMPARWWNAY